MGDSGPVMNGPLEILGPNPRAKPFVPSRVGASSSGFRGVSKQGQRWRARICIEKVEYTVGDFETEEDAARAYDLEAIRRGKLKALNYVYKNINDYLLNDDRGGEAAAQARAHAAAARKGAAAAMHLSSDGHDEVCTACFTGGDLICCDTCPRVFHQHCLGLDTLPSGTETWRCPVCTGHLVPTNADALATANAAVRQAMTANRRGRGRGGRPPAARRGRRPSRGYTRDSDDDDNAPVYGADDDSDEDAAEENIYGSEMRFSRSGRPVGRRNRGTYGEAADDDDSDHEPAYQRATLEDAAALTALLMDRGTAAVSTGLAAGGDDSTAVAASSLVELGGGSSNTPLAVPAPVITSAPAYPPLRMMPSNPLYIDASGMPVGPLPGFNTSSSSASGSLGLGMSPTGFILHQANGAAVGSSGTDTLTARLAIPPGKGSSSSSNASEASPLGMGLPGAATSATPAALFAAVAGRGLANASSSGDDSGSVEASNGAPAAGQLTGASQYSHLLLFLLRPDVRKLLSDSQRRKVKQLIVAGGQHIIQLLLSAVDVYDTTGDTADLIDSIARIYSLWTDAGRMYGVLPVTPQAQGYGGPVPMHPTVSPHLQTYSMASPMGAFTTAPYVTAPHPMMVDTSITPRSSASLSAGSKRRRNSATRRSPSKLARSEGATTGVVGSAPGDEGAAVASGHEAVPASDQAVAATTSNATPAA